LIGVVTVAYLATGFHVVAPGEAVVVRRLGRVLRQPWTQGPHWGWPIGLDRLTRVRIDEVRRLEIGLVGAPGLRDDPDAGEFLTGDLNLLRARAVVQYRVADPIAFALRARDVIPILERSAEASLTSALAHRGIDESLRAGRAEVARAVEAGLTRRIQTCDLGVAILGVSLTDARPPLEVQPDFDAAQAAHSERERRTTEANTYATTSAVTAHAAAQTKFEEARTSAHRTTTMAKSRARRFLSLLAEADRARPLTIRRLYLDVMRDLLPRVRRKLVVTGEEPIDLSIFGTQK
jgi:membrane protease subunit HflK